MTSASKIKLASADDAVRLIRDGSTVACGGFVGAAHPEALTAAVERRFFTEAKPKDLTLVYAAGQGDGKSRGLNHVAHEGLIRRVIGAHWGLVPGMGRLALDEKIEAYNFPQGVICQLLRDIAAGRPGCVTHVGLGTFVDPINDGGRLNSRTTEPLVERLELNGRTWLFYKSFPIDVGLIRATEADPAGNLSMAEEAVIGEVLPIAQAARNCGGTVIAQVKRLRTSFLPPHEVTVPGILVDRVVVSETGEHDQTFGEANNTAYFQAASSDNQADSPHDVVSNVARRIIAARACDELKRGDIANLGIGMPEGIAAVAASRGLLQQVTLTLESGPIGGVPASGLSFGASAHPDAIIDQPAQFDFYDGGGLDFAALGAAQIDVAGNVNVSKFGSVLAGVGGFVNISQNAKRLVFCGTLTSGGLQTEIQAGQLLLRQEGRVRKFLRKVDHVSFSGETARAAGKDVLIVTERAVFRMTTAGVELIEVAPGIDVQSQILDLMDFEPVVNNVKLMRSELFHDN